MQLSAALFALWLCARPVAAAEGGGALAWFPGPCNTPGDYGLFGDPSTACGDACFCPGDCGGDGQVEIDELVSVVAMAMHGSPPMSCPSVDRDRSCDVSIGEVVEAVNGALKGCPPRPAATRTTMSPFVDLVVHAAMVDQGPGGVVLVAENGEVVHEVAYGLADVDDGVPNRTDTVFAIGTLSMPFTAIGVLMLADEGVIDLDDPVGLYVPRLERFGENVTIRRLLSHTSGIPDFLGRIPGATQRVGSEDLTNQSLIDLIFWWGELEFEPGTTCRYSQVGYEILATLIENATGVEFARFVEQRILAPLGMESTYVRPAEARRADPAPARGYIPIGSADFFPYDLSEYDGLYGSWSIYSTATDLLRFAAALDGDRLVSAEMLDQCLAPATLDDGAPACAEASYDSSSSNGLGFEVGTRFGEPYFGQDGVRFGYTSSLLRFPEHDLTVIVLANRSDSGLPELAFRIADLFLAE
jgi:CubicO group peptidase (beta-lactamase class C family)